MSSEAQLSLRNFVSLVRGTTYKGDLVGSPGPVLLGLASIQPDGGFRRGAFKTYGGECPAKITLGPGDLYVSLKDVTQSGDLLGSVARVPSDIPAGRLTQDTVRLHFDGEPVDPAYIYWLLRTPDYRAYCRSHATGTTTLGLARDDFLDFPVQPVDAQVLYLVELLEAIEERITLLRETNATLEGIAQALFKSWFVDFDPVRAKMEGRTPEGMDEATTALFPDGFETSELGEVPRGWRVGCIDDICSTVTNGGTPSRSKTEYWEQGTIPWFKTGEFHDGFLLQPSERITNAALIGSSVKLLPKDAVLMAIYAAPTVGRLGILVEPATFNQACTGMVARNEVGPWFLFWTLFNGRDWFNSRANGAAQQNISKAIVSAYRTVIPPNSVLDSFNLVASGIHEAIRMNTEKAMTLSTLRDTLLPRLISGQLRLPKAQNEIM